ncbi:mechanosensitive ion channel family protein [Candidatus Saccharibacteria bacterium]|nr:mechanosensitive ion channel family protein [Candidatus Saccharibacteria bacterium]
MHWSDIHDLLTIAWLQVALTIGITIVVQVVLRHTLRRIVERTVHSHHHSSRAEEKKREETLTSVFQATSAVLLWTIAVLVMLTQLHVNLVALLTGAGVLGVVIGFGAQEAVKDYLAGIFIIMENQYRVGDIVTLYADGANVGGVVEEITIRITKLRDLDGNLHIVPNGSGGVVTNRSFKFAAVNVDVGVSYDTDLEKAREVINIVGKAQAKAEKWADEILEPIEFLRVDKFGDSAVMLKCVGQVKPATQWDVAGDFRMRLKKAFDEAGIVIPFQQVVIHQAKK